MNIYIYIGHRCIHRFIRVYACQLFVLQDISADAADCCQRWCLGFGTALLFDCVSHEEVPRTAWQTKSSLAMVNTSLAYWQSKIWRTIYAASIWLLNFMVSQTQPLTWCLAWGIQTVVLDEGLWQQDAQTNNYMVKFFSSPFLYNEQKSTQSCGSKVGWYLHGFKRP